MKLITKSLVWKFPITYLLILGIVFFLETQVFGGEEVDFWKEFYWDKAIILILCALIGLFSGEFILFKVNEKDNINAK